MHCPLCEHKNSLRRERFFRCPECQLVFKPQSSRLNSDQEKARYESHENSIENKGYVEFLTPALNAVLDLAQPKAQGLDYGCGPQPVLAFLLNEKGFPTGYYDPFFYPEGLKIQEKFDFITCTEATEHFFNPKEEFEKLFSLLKQEGFLVVMTEQYQESTDFSTWYYAKDPTHVCFYSVKTWEWIASKFDRRLKVLSARLAVFN